MTSIARFIIDKPRWVWGILAIFVILLCTPGKKVEHKRINPWALHNASEPAPDSASSAVSAETADLADSSN